MIVAEAHVASAVEGFTQNLKFLDSLPTVLFALLVFVGFYLFAKGASEFITRFNFSKNKQVFAITTKVIKNSIIGLGLLVALGIAGISVNALITGLGLTTAAIALALKDVLSNFVAGVLILLNRPYKIGDTIKVSGVTGTVSKIETRYTVLKMSDETANERHVVPNSIMYNSLVTIVLEPKK